MNKHYTYDRRTLAGVKFPGAAAVTQMLTILRNASIILGLIIAAMMIWGTFRPVIKGVLLVLQDTMFGWL
jgi:hypothetical protein